jgi:hypothetical protein
MQEINRAAALLGRKTQECNTPDKQELGAACRLDQTIRLLSSQTVLLPRWSGCDAGVKYPPLQRSKRTGLMAVNNSYKRQEPFFSDELVDDRLPPLHR